MAEPYDTINGFASAPKLWYRFSDASGGVDNEGSDGFSADLAETDGDSGTFNATYQYETNPAGDGHGMLFNGQGGLTASSDLADKGSIVYVFRTIGAINTNGFQFGFFQGFDTNYMSISCTISGDANFQIQDSGADDENFVVSGAGLADNNVHSIIVTSSAGTSIAPKIYIDGVDSTVTHLEDATGGDTVPDNYWWDDFTDNVAVGMRGSVEDNELSNMVIYECLAYEFVLSGAEAASIHGVLASVERDFSNKTIRRKGRRLYSANT